MAAIENHPGVWKSTGNDSRHKFSRIESPAATSPDAPEPDALPRLAWRDRFLFGPLRVASVGLPLAIAMAFSLLTWRQVKSEAHEFAAHMTQMLSDHLARTFDVQDAVIAAVQIRIEGMTWPEIAASQDVWRLLTRLDESVPNANRLGIINPQGIQVHVGSMPPPGPNSRHDDRDYFRAVNATTRETHFIGAPTLALNSGDLALTYAHPRLGPGGVPDGGVIFTTLLPSRLAEMFQRVAAGPDDTIRLLRDDGVMLAAHPMADLTAAPRFPPESAPMRAVAAAIAVTDRAPAQAGPRRAGFAEGTSPLDGVARLNVAHHLPRAGVALVYGRATSSMHVEWVRRSSVVLALASLSAALLFTLTYASQRAVRRRVEAQQVAWPEAERRAEAERARADAEALLRQGQRVEMLGQIAAGIVHDFRNTVQTVHAGAALIERAASQGNLARVREVADMLRQASTRSNQLTQRLLSFRKGSKAGASCDPAETVATTCSLLHSALGPGLRLHHTVADGLPARVLGGQAELNSAVMNLVINARDAMPAGGDITVALRPAAAPQGLPEGTYAELSVTDTGTGMSPETLCRAPEAFFTTKSAGGTGLGLSSIRAFLDGIGGAMELRSTPGEGTTVTLWLPAAPQGAS